ncbi:MAG: hypothetical protein QXZ70_05315 [Candidatus Bathyarchaeia archaeon]
MRVIKIWLNPLQVKVEREALYVKLKGLLERAEFLANNHQNVKVRLKAMEITVRIAQFLVGTLRDLQLDEIQAELESLENAD